MKKYYLFVLHLGVLLALGPYIGSAQSTPGAPLFEHDSILHIQLRGDIRTLLKDRGDENSYHPISIGYMNGNNEIAISLRVKTRGNFRRQRSNCTYPPLLLNFVKKLTPQTIFDGQDKIKLVMPCGNDEWVVREYLVYRMYNMVTEKSFKARLARVELIDTLRNKSESSFYGILLEGEEQMAHRNGMKIHEQKMRNALSFEKESYIRMALFQYMIGNCDWSVPYLHNIKTIAFDSLSIPYAVPYDFDHSGLVQASYAMPPPALQLANTRERRFRGYCLANPQEFIAAIDFFNRKKEDFYGLLQATPQLNSRYIKNTISWLDDFYTTINQEKKIIEELTYPCRQKEEYVIKGLE